MTKLKRLLKKNKITLIVELLYNDPDLAELVQRLGADAILLDSLDGSDRVLNKLWIPAGLNLGSDTEINISELEPFDFVNFNISRLEEIKDFPKTKIVSVSDNYSIDSLMNIDDAAQAIDATIVPLTQGVKNLLVGDLQNYISIVISANLPVVIPTQRSIKPSEVAIISDAGAKGIILTKTVLGESARTYEKSIQAFRAAVDDLGA